MIISEGKNDFKNNTFDKYRWSANTYETPEEILACLHVLGVYEKRVRSVSAIGALLHFSLGDWKTIALRTLAEAGIIIDFDTYEEWVEFHDGTKKNLSDCLDLLRKVKTERSVNLCEPLLVIFDDDNVLELLPCAPHGLRIGYNTLPMDMRNGANRAEYDIGVLFNQKLSGGKFSSFGMVTTAKTRIYDGPRKDRVTRRNQYSISFLQGTLVLQELQCSEYEVSFSRTETITCGELADLEKESFQSAIMEGWHGGGAVIIYPVPETDSGIAPWDADLPDIFSVGWSEPAPFRQLLSKYFDPDLTANKEHSQGHYDFYYRNYYAKSTIIQMVAETRKNLESIRSLPVEEQSKVLSCRYQDETEEQTLIRIREEIDYTERFLDCLLGMALNSPEGSVICFNGP